LSLTTLALRAEQQPTELPPQAHGFEGFFPSAENVEVRDLSLAKAVHVHHVIGAPHTSRFANGRLSDGDDNGV
jgi:hypothetical protein